LAVLPVSAGSVVGEGPLFGATGSDGERGRLGAGLVGEESSGGGGVPCGRITVDCTMTDDLMSLALRKEERKHTSWEDECER